MKNLTIGLFGFGVVGEGIYQVLKDKPGLKTTVKKVCIRDINKDRNAPAHIFTDQPAELLFDPDINVIVELIDDAEAALPIVKAAMEQGKSVVSANKKMIAENHAELIELQQTFDISFLYEAAVCGSIPIIRNLEEYFDNDLLNYVCGIVNGSTNYILSKMQTEHLDYQVALEEAQKNGFAESDPTLDVEGIDAAFKLSIIALHAFGELVNPYQIPREGISQLQTEDIESATALEKKVKLIARAQHHDGELELSIKPELVGDDCILSEVNNEYNGVLLGSSLADEQFLYGKGAGRYPTASAVLSDISALRYGYRYEYRKFNRVNSVPSLVSIP